MFERIIGMGMALYTSIGRTLPHLKGCIDPVNNRCYPVLFIKRSTLIIAHGIAVKSCSRPLFLGRMGQQITSELLYGKLIERFISIKRFDHIIPEPPHWTGFILFIAFGICIPGEVEPPGGPFFPIIFSRQ